MQRRPGLTQKIHKENGATDGGGPDTLPALESRLAGKPHWPHSGPLIYNLLTNFEVGIWNQAAQSYFGWQTVYTVGFVTEMLFFGGL